MKDLAPWQKIDYGKGNYTEEEMRELYQVLISCNVDPIKVSRLNLLIILAETLRKPQESSSHSPPLDDLVEKLEAYKQQHNHGDMPMDAANFYVNGCIAVIRQHQTEEK